MPGNFNPFVFLKEVRMEGKKIVWPTRREAVASMISVCVMVFIFSVLFFLTDKVVETCIWSIINLFNNILS